MPMAFFWHIPEFVKCGYLAVLVTYPHITQSNGPEKEHFAPKPQLRLADFNWKYFFLLLVSQSAKKTKTYFPQSGSDFFL